MHIYFAGIGGTGLYPLADLARQAGFKISGSDLSDSHNLKLLRQAKVEVSQDQTGDWLKQIHQQSPIDWLVYTSTMPEDHPELLVARQLGIKTSKRDQLISQIIKQHDFKLIAVAGTHGKTTTTTMLIWLFHQLNLPLSYLVGSNLSFAPAGKFDEKARYFVYECDEYDRNFLHFTPDYSLITSIEYDHIDIFPTLEDYQQAFRQFINQSNQTWLWDKDLLSNLQQSDNLRVLKSEDINPSLTLFGQHNRQNASLIVALNQVLNLTDKTKAITILNQTPTARRRFERLRDNLISDYAHHPTEVKATLAAAHEYAKRHNLDQVVAVYQPHQNYRQTSFYQDYPAAFADADRVYWLPTFLTREVDLDKNFLSIEQLTAKLTRPVVASELDLQLKQQIEAELKDNNLVICMSAGPLDDWLRQNFSAVD